MSQPKRVSGRQLVRALERLGWQVDRIRREDRLRVALPRAAAESADEEDGDDE